MKVVIVDYKIGNVKSVLRSFEKFTRDVIISDDIKDVETATHIVLPGVGAFGDGMNNLIKYGLDVALIKAVTTNKTPFLGICLGMQLLASHGHESGKKNGLNLIEGDVIKMVPQPQKPIPHVGWNDITISNNHDIVDTLENGTDFYFVHSYHFVPKHSINVVATTSYIGDVTAIIAQDNIVGVQFHPEKSQLAGFKIIQNFLKM